MAKTNLLPPQVAVKITWGLTGKFCETIHSDMYAISSEIELEEIKSRSKKDALEQEYVSRAIAAIYAAMRNLDTIYKWRNLNFDENKQLREAYLKNAQENAAAGVKLGDVIKTLPAMSFAGAGGITLAQYLNASDILAWGFGFLLAGLGAFIQIIATKEFRRKEIWNYIKQDYERNLYYKKYLEKVTIILIHLYNQIDDIHNDVFDENWPKKEGLADITKLLEGIQAKFCKYIDEHLNDESYKWKINADIWVLCETDSEIAQKCCKYYMTSEKMKT